MADIIIIILPYGRWPSLMETCNSIVISIWSSSSFFHTSKAKGIWILVTFLTRWKAMKKLNIIGFICGRVCQSIVNYEIKWTYCRPLLNEGLLQGAPINPVMSSPHPSTTNHFLQIMSPSLRRVLYTHRLLSAFKEPTCLKMV